MHSTDPILRTSVSGSDDPSGLAARADSAVSSRGSGSAGDGAEGAGHDGRVLEASMPIRRSGRRAAVAASPSLSRPVSSGPRQARPTSAAPILDASAAPILDASAAPILDASVSPRRAARAAREAAAAAALSAPTRPAGVDAIDMPAPKSPVVMPTAALPVVPAAFVAPASPSLALAPAPFANTLAVGIPAPASSAGRRETFVPAAPAAGRADAPRVDSPLVDALGRSAKVRRRPASIAGASTPVALPVAPRRRTVGTLVRRGVIGAVVCGILATSILPAFGHTGSSSAYASTNPDGSTTVHIGDQTYDVAAGVDTQVLARDGYSATSVLDYEKQVIANREAKTVTSYTGPTAAEYVLHPLYSKAPLDRSQVFDVALQYLGTPYVHGGADPSAFDCSGFIMFVYAQFGISLPHYVPSQDAMGTTIPESEAVPGDLVVFNTDDHDGFYAGNGMIMDAPKPGGVITVRPIWDAPHHFVRIAP